MVFKSKRLASLLLIFSVCLSGCGINPSSPASDGTDGQQGAQGENANPSAEGNERNESRGTYVLEELNFPDPELGLAALQKGEVTCMTSPFQLTQDGYFYRQVTAADQESGTQQGHYIQILDVSDDENLTFTIKEIPAVYSGEDGEYSLEDVYLYQGSPEFFQAYDVDKVSCLAGCNENGDVEEISGELPEAIQSAGYLYTFTVGRSGSLYAFKDYDENILFSFKRGGTWQEAKPHEFEHLDGVITDASEKNVYLYGQKGGATEICDLEGKVVARAENSDYSMNPLVEMGADGRIYLTNSTKLWELKGDEWELLCDFGLSDYPFSELYAMKEQGDGSILLYGKLDGADCLVRAIEGTGSERGDRQEITIAVDQDGPSALAASIARFNRQNDKYHITIITRNADEDSLEYQDRIKLDISVGNGPDMVEEDALLMWDPSGYIENGYFAGLDGIIEDENQYIASAFDGGRRNGILYGMPYDFKIHTAVYSEDFAKGRTSWTLQELMDAVEASDAEILQYGCDATDIVVKYGLYDNDNTTYIDWEKGESHLDEQPFLELLDFASRYQDPDADKHFETDYDSEMLRSGKMVSIYAQIVNKDMLQRADEAFEGRAALIGYPRSEGNGIYAESRYIYVNGTCGCMDGVAEFFRFLLSESEQTRFLNYKGIEEIGIMNYIPYLPICLKSLQSLAEYWQTGKNGCTDEQIEKLMFLVENSNPSNWNVTQIQSIVREELAPYFAGDRTAEQVAEILDNRVQLYLDETH